MEKATFAAGCFWHVEDFFMAVPGVISTTVGYTGGHTENPTYEKVCSHTNRHAEALEVIYDPKKVTFEQITDKFWEKHTPPTLKPPCPAVRSHFRSRFFFNTI